MYVIALHYVTGDEQMNGWGRISEGGREGRRERLHEETDDRRGGDTKEGGVREGRGLGH